MSKEWNPASLLINRYVANALKSGKIAFDNRHIGKTETLLAYVAMFHDNAIIVTDNSRYLSYIRVMWEERYSTLSQPKFMTFKQLQRAEGMIGIVFSDECLDACDQKLYDGYYLRFGGGVHSGL